MYSYMYANKINSHAFILEISEPGIFLDYFGVKSTVVIVQIIARIDCFLGEEDDTVLVFSG